MCGDLFMWRSVDDFFNEFSVDMTSSTEQSSSTESSTATSESDAEGESDHTSPKLQKSPRPIKHRTQRLKKKALHKVSCV